MSRVCPVCTPDRLQPLSTGDVEVDQCGRCLGLFFDRGELELFPDRPSTRSLQLTARHAPSRCPSGHPVSRADRGCRVCSKPARSCPACEERLGQVALGEIWIDLCARCGGSWLDEGTFEALEGQSPAAPLKAGAAVPAGSLRGWVIPEAHDLQRDEWRAPGQGVRSFVRGTSNHPFVCRHCDVLLEVKTIWAFDGETYCGACRPEGARSGAADPDSLSTLVTRLLKALGR